jgi:putative nucleotidyltransferase with HDIG domain
MAIEEKRLRGGKNEMEKPVVRIDIPQEIRDSVALDLPAVLEIKDTELRKKVIEAWAFSLYLNGFKRVSDLPGSGMPGAPVKGDQTQHILYVAYTSLDIKHNLEKVLHEPVNVDDDLLLACALCHDVGKPYEYNEENRKRWEKDPSISGLPAVRHPAYGVYVALSVGLPEEVVHVCACHSPEGRFVQRSMPATIVHYADDSFWFVLQSSGQLEGEVPKL